MLPNPTLSRRIATGFNRNHRGNAEGGIIPEEYACEYVVDRVETTFTVWLGLTIGCTRCHNHKFDPLSQKEFYQAYAYFNNIPEFGRAVKEGNSPPFIKAPTKEQQRQIKGIEKELEDANGLMKALETWVTKSRDRWEHRIGTNSKRPEIQWFPSDDLMGHFPLDGNLNNLAAKAFPKATAQFADGPLGEAVLLKGSGIEAGPIAKFGYFDKFSFRVLDQARKNRGHDFIQDEGYRAGGRLRGAVGTGQTASQSGEAVVG